MEIRTPPPARPIADAALQLERRLRQQRLLHLGLLGAAAVLVTELLVLLPEPARAAERWGVAAEWLFAGLLAGHGLRALRRKLMLSAELSLHRALSIDLLFQGAILLNPQLAYPDTEAEFLRREAGVPLARLETWFRVRAVSAVAIPLALAAGIAWLADYAVAAGAGLGLMAAVVLVSAWRAGTVCLAWAVWSGVLGALLEGWAFAWATQALLPATPLWTGFLVYGLGLATYELSPVPLALGVMEASYGLLACVPGLLLPGLFCPLLYRLLRGLPTVLAAWFFLPRHKLTVLDLFDPLLPVALARAVRPEGGWEHLEEPGAPRLSVVIPAFNEVHRLPLYLPDVLAYAKELPGGAEIVIVDDGSRDGTAEYVRQVAAGAPFVRLVRHEQNQGKGAAVRTGILAARGRFALFADADGATPIREADKLLAVAETGVEVVVASRLGGDQVERTLWRGLMGSLFYRLTNLLAVPNVSDTQCGFKLFRRVAVQRLFGLLQEKGWAFDVEALFLAQKFGLPIVEVPVQWRAVAGSKLHPLKDSVRMFLALWRIRRRSAGLSDEQ